MNKNKYKLIKLCLLFISFIIFISPLMGCGRGEDNDLLHEEGKAYFKKQEFYKSIEILNDVDVLKLSKYENEKDYLYYMLGYSYWQLKRWDIALKPLEKANELSPNNEEYMIVLARVYYINDEFDKSEKYYKKVIEVNDKNEKAYMNLGDINLRKTPKNPKKALYYLEKSVEIYPQYANAYATMAIAYKVMGDDKKRDECLDKAVKFGYNDLPTIKRIKNNNKNEF